MESWILKIAEKIKKTPTVQDFTDMYHLCLELKKTDIPLAVKYLVGLTNACEKAMLSGEYDKDVVQLYGLYKQVLLSAAPYHFESYLLYTEWNREPEKKFYPPRRRVLKQVVDALQDLEDDRLDILTISMPPGSGKTTLAIFYLTWLQVSILTNRC